MTTVGQPDKGGTGGSPVPYMEIAWPLLSISIHAPRAGAWIEMSSDSRILMSRLAVAPRAGAWIEIWYVSQVSSSSTSRSPCGSVDRNVFYAVLNTSYISRSPCGGVDRNSNKEELQAVGYACRSPCGSVDRNPGCPIISIILSLVAPRVGARVEITFGKVI